MSQIDIFILLSIDGEDICGLDRCVVTGLTAPYQHQMRMIVVNGSAELFAFRISIIKYNIIVKVSKSKLK